MTDRQVGGLGVKVDISFDPTRQVGALGLQVDAVNPSKTSFGRSLYGGLATTVEIVPPTPTRQTGSIGIMLDYVPSLVTYVTWNTPAFQLGGGYPEALWAGTQFAFAGGAHVVWSATNERFEFG